MTKKIEKMTPEQEAQLQVYLERYLAEGRRTTTVDREKATRLLGKFYTDILGHAVPKIVFVKSPFELVLIPKVYENNKARFDTMSEDEIKKLMDEQLAEKAKGQLGDQLRNIYYTSWWWNYRAVYDFAINELGMEAPQDIKDKLMFTLELFREVHAISAFEEVCFVSDFPEHLTINARGQLHNNNEAALRYRDKYSVFSINGVRIELKKSHIVLAPETITLTEIDKEDNAEIKRLMLEKYGMARYVLDSKAEVLDTDVDMLGAKRTLYRKEVRNDEAIVMVAVQNSTAEPDGTFKQYLMRVDPNCRPMLRNRTFGQPQKLTCQNAVASTFGMTGEEYMPSHET